MIRIRERVHQVGGEEVSGGGGWPGITWGVGLAPPLSVTVLGLFSIYRAGRDTAQEKVLLISSHITRDIVTTMYKKCHAKC